MAGNDKLFVVKNGLRTQNTEYLSPDRTNTITLEMLDSDTLSWEGDSGQLFSITDSLTGTIFSVNDISGVPSIEVDDDGTIRLAEFAGNVLIGTDVDDGTNKLQISGSVSATSFSGDGSNLGNVDADQLDGLNSSQFLRSDTSDTMSGRLEMSNVLDMNNNDIEGVDQIKHHGDTNTYMQFHASDQWRVVTGGSERLEVNNSQVTVQNVNFNVDDGDVRSRGSGFRNATGNYGTIRVDDDRSVSWAGYAIRDDWVFMSDGASRSGIYNDTDNEWAIEFNRNSSVEVKYNGSNRLVTTSSGVSVSGVVNATDFNSTSDRNLKKDITKIENAVDKVQLINGYHFTYKDTEQRSVGVIAQEIENVLPEVVSGVEGHKTVSYGNIVGLLIEAIKEQQKKIENLESRIINK